MEVTISCVGEKLHLDKSMKPKRPFKGKKLKGPKKNAKEIVEEIDQSAALSSYDWSTFDQFDDIPISTKTKNGLRKAGYEKPTDIQRQSLPYSLNGSDVLGAAKTGSGKTVAFLIPMLECLYKHQWTPMDGLGALIITPTRELSYQIFEVLNKVGSHHDFSGGLIIGGKDLKFESKRLDRCNIIVCTPGRLLQHMDENPLFNCDQLKMLILDEADRILDLGFAKTMNAIIENLPTERQTLLFSATQTKSVKDLARLSLKDPVYVSSHEHEKHSTPANLTQSYIVCPLENKINLLWSFIKQHQKAKIIVFLSSCKQVKFMYELFCRLRPGITLLALYGALHQVKRMAVYDRFCSTSKSVVLFATDIASRGLDFPSVNWVLQLDCPESVTTYIHRVGRTARLEAGGESLLVLVPSEEEAMVQALAEKKVPIERIEVNPKKLTVIGRKVEALLARDVALKETAQRAFKAYLKNAYLMKNKAVFRLEALNLDEFARSMGLAVTPRVRFIERKQQQSERKSENRKDGATKSMLVNSDDDGDDDDSHSTNLSTSVAATNLSQLKIAADDDDEKDADDNLFQIKKVWRFDQDGGDAPSNDDDALPPLPLATGAKNARSKAAVVKRLLKKNIKLNTKIVFNENDEEEVFTGGVRQAAPKLAALDASKSGIDIEVSKRIMEEEDKLDKAAYQQLVKERRKAKKAKEKEKKAVKKTGGASAGLGTDGDEEMTDFYIDNLPDPDAIYEGKRDGSDDADEDGQSEYEEDSFEKGAKTLKRKRNSSSSSDSSSGSDEDHYRPQKKPSRTENSIDYYEDIALKLLATK